MTQLALRSIIIATCSVAIVGTSQPVCQRNRNEFFQFISPALHSIDLNKDSKNISMTIDQCSIDEFIDRKSTTITGDDDSKQSTTNSMDFEIRAKLDEGDRLLDEEKLDRGLTIFEKLLETHPSSPRAKFGRARALELISASKRSNQHLESSIKEYLELLFLKDVPAELAKQAGARLIDRARFRGWLKMAIQGQERLAELFPDDLAIRNELGVSLLMAGRNEEAKKIFEKVLSTRPDDGFAAVHLGFILKTIDDNLLESIDYFRRGIESEANGTQDGRFYFHLGDALQRLNRSDEAYQWYEKASAKGIFLSKLQRSLYNVQGLTARPWWNAKDTGVSARLKAIEAEWRTIRDEGVALLDETRGIFKSEDEKLTSRGDWKQFTLYSRGRQIVENCKRTPKTCSIVAKFAEAVGCTRGQIKFSIMRRGTRVWPHCGPTNCRLRAHLGLIVPPEPRIRVGEVTRRWLEGRFVILDDSFEHEVWYDDDGVEEEKDYRLILIVDFWHPDLDAKTRASLTPI